MDTTTVGTLFFFLIMLCLLIGCSKSGGETIHWKEAYNYLYYKVDSVRKIPMQDFRDTFNAYLASRNLSETEKENRAFMETVYEDFKRELNAFGINSRIKVSIVTKANDA